MRRKRGAVIRNKLKNDGYLFGRDLLGLSFCFIGKNYPMKKNALREDAHSHGGNLNVIYTTGL